MQLQIGGDAAAGVLHRAVKAQQLAHGAGDHAGVLLQALPLVGVGQQGPQAVTQQVAGGLVARKQEHGALGQQLGMVKQRAIGFGLQQAADQVVARVLAALGNQLLEIPAHRQQTGLGAAGLLVGGQRRANEHRQVVGPDREVGIGGFFDTHHLGDDAGGQLAGHGLHEVETGRIAHRVQQLGHGLGDEGLQRLDLRGFETGVEHFADAGVVGRVKEQHGAGKQLLETGQLAFGFLAVGYPTARALGRETRVAQHLLHVGMAGQQPGPAEEFGAPVQRPGLAQSLVGRVGVGQKGGVDEGRGGIHAVKILCRAAASR